MSKVLNEVMAANGRYADEFGDRAKLPMPPARRFAILTCMDARLDPAKFAGLAEGDAHVIRNAGGRASDDAIRSLVISHKLLGTREWFVIHHTDCGMETFTNEIMRGLLANSLETAIIDQRGWRDAGKGPGSSEGRYIDWLTIDDNARSVVEDVTRIRNHPLVNKSIPVHGYIYDVKSGRLMEVAEASRTGGVPAAKARGSTKAAKASSAKAPKASKAKKAASTKAQKAGKARKTAPTKAQKSKKTKAA
jgi:carbonic anhydrase